MTGCNFDGSAILANYEPFDYSLTFAFSIKHYQVSEIHNILFLYDAYCNRVNINPWIAVGQMSHETGFLSSWWSDSPRHNLVGYGVTGRISAEKPIESITSRWTFDNDTKSWKEGFSFNTLDLAIRTHLGHLLAYMYIDDQLNDIQRGFVELSPRRILLGNNRGSVKILSDLKGKWAFPGLTYDQSVAKTATKLKYLSGAL
jgi:hypothetical protein